MCETNAYIRREDGSEELYLEGVDLVRPETGRVYMRSLFGEERVFEGSILEMRLARNRIVLGT